MTTVLASLNSGLRRAMQNDGRVYALGEDILDPYGGAFKVTRGLSEAFPERVLTTPISEAGITGLATGMALRGLRPVVEIMFGDFLTLAADQVINHAAKFRWMYNDQVRVPLVIRTPMGGRRGYGPTHSQTLEKHFLGAPGLRVLAPAALGDPGELLYNAILADDDPVLFIENKLLYLVRLLQMETPGDFSIEVLRSADPVKSEPSFLPPLDEAAYASTFRLTLAGAPPSDLTLAAYGYAAELARQAARQLAYEHEIFVEVITPTQLAPFVLDPVLDSARRTGRLLVFEEGAISLGWGAEVLAQALEKLGPALPAARRLAAMDMPIPASGPLERAVLPEVSDLVAAARALVKH